MFTKKKNPGASYLPGFKYKKEGGELCQAQLMWAWTLIESDILFVFVKTPTPTQHNTTAGFDMKMTVQSPPPLGLFIKYHFMKFIKSIIFSDYTICDELTKKNSAHLKLF